MEVRSAITRQSGPKPKTKRIRKFTPDDRASHRVIEKQRRESLNERFIDLARLLPGLAHIRRLSKSMIVNESIVHHKKQRTRQLAAIQSIRSLLDERNALLVEINEWRSRYGLPQRQSDQAAHVAPNIFEVEKEEFGTFPQGFGDNGAEDEQLESPDAHSDVGPQPDRDSNSESSGRDFPTMAPANTQAGAVDPQNFSWFNYDIDQYLSSIPSFQVDDNVNPGVDTSRLMHDSSMLGIDAEQHVDIDDLQLNTMFAVPIDVDQAEIPPALISQSNIYLDPSVSLQPLNSDYPHITYTDWQ